MDLPKRKPNRIPRFDYSTPGAYFITICTQEKRQILGQIVGGGALDAPHPQLTQIGHIVYRYIVTADLVPGITVDKFVIMPNHVHLILFVDEPAPGGTSRAPSPTNAMIPRFVSTLKRFCHRDVGYPFFQRSYHDHVIRGEQDYRKIWEYIDTNPIGWKEDCFYPGG